MLPLHLSYVSYQVNSASGQVVHTAGAYPTPSYVDIFSNAVISFATSDLPFFSTQNNNSVTTSNRYTWEFLSSHSTNLDHVNLSLFIIPPITFEPRGCWPLEHTIFIGCRRYSNFVDVILQRNKRGAKMIWIQPGNFEWTLAMHTGVQLFYH